MGECFFWYRPTRVVPDLRPLNGRCFCSTGCWLGGRKGIQPIKTEWWGAGMVICLEQCADLHMAQLMPLPLTVSCSNKIQIGFSFLVQRAIKRVCNKVHCIGALALYVALSQRGLLDPIEPAYNQSRRLKLTASTFSRLWIIMLAVLVTVPTVSQNSLHPLSTSSITARHLLDFMVEGEITDSDALTICLDATRSGLSVPPSPSFPPFYPKCPFCCNPPSFILA